MGLDIEYWSNITPITAPHPIPDEWLADGSIIRYFTPPSFEKRLEPVEAGWVQCSGDYGSFEAGSYGGYNRFRERLAQVGMATTPEKVWAHPLVYEKCAFFELVNFADNEGCIGSKAASKLYKDFAQNEQQFVELTLPADGWMIDKYRQWKRAFQAASEGGVVHFI